MEGPRPPCRGWRPIVADGGRDTALLLVLDVSDEDDEQAQAREFESLAHGAPGVQPWRCLWRRFSQITMTRPLRRITLHLSQIGLTLGLTFIAGPFRAAPPCRRRGIAIVYLYR